MRMRARHDPTGHPPVTEKGGKKMTDRMDAGLAWQVDVWDRMAEVYQREIDSRFGPVIEHLMARADPRPGEAILDLGTDRLGGDGSGGAGAGVGRANRKRNCRPRPGSG